MLLMIWDVARSASERFNGFPVLRPFEMGELISRFAIRPQEFVQLRVYGLSFASAFEVERLVRLRSRQ
jgi:hypothetical protein